MYMYVCIVTFVMVQLYGHQFQIHLQCIHTISLSVMELVQCQDCIGNLPFHFHLVPCNLFVLFCAFSCLTNCLFLMDCHVLFSI